MTHYLDSSVLVAVLVEDEPSHEACLRALRKKHAATWTHALTETFATLTGGRLGIRASPAIAAQLIGSISSKLRLVDLGSTDILSAIGSAEAAGARGAALYDYLHLLAARKVHATELHTLNERHLNALARKGDPKILSPE